MNNNTINYNHPEKIILGIDPGSRKVGYGVILVTQNRYTHIDSGVLIIPLESIPTRLGFIHSKITELIVKHKPHAFAIEDIFVNKNVSSALKLGQARGAAIVAAVNNNVGVFEYPARLVKQAVVGKGSADKYQVQQMVRILLNLNYLPKTDEGDALAIAICHANRSGLDLASKLFNVEQYPNKNSKYSQYSKGRWR